MRLNINGRDRTVEAPEDMPLLWVLRDLLGLTGTLPFSLGSSPPRRHSPARSQD